MLCTQLLVFSLQPAFLYYEYTKGLQGKTSSQRAISHNSLLGVCRRSKNFCSWLLLAQHQPPTWQQDMAVQRSSLFGTQAVKSVKRCLSQRCFLSMIKV
eukprot:s185_g19.t1